MWYIIVAKQFHQLGGVKMYDVSLIPGSHSVKYVKYTFLYTYSSTKQLKLRCVVPISKT